jgi:CubicO group peptidase (beta-lactamase class C family)
MRTAILLLTIAMVVTSLFATSFSSQKVDQLFATYDKPDSPGCSVGVIRDGKFLYRKAYGQASLELGVPLTSQSVFYMASVSKQFTAAAVVLAAEKGFLSLDDDIHKYIPELPDFGHRITLRQMLHQTSGFRDFFALQYLSGHDEKDLSSPDQVLKLILRQKALNNVPGNEFVYSNSNYFLLGLAIQRSTGQSLAKFAAEQIFKPLGMSSTRFYDDNKVVVPGRVAAYDAAKDGGFLVDWSTNFEIVGSGGLMSTVDDLLLWDDNFYADRLGNGTLVRELKSHGRLNNGQEVNYGMGLWLASYRGLATVEHSGGTFGYGTELLRFPEQRFSVVALCNLATIDVEELARKVADLYLGDQFQPPTTVGSQRFPDPTAFAGQYLDPRTQMVYTFKSVNGNLMAWGAVLRRSAENKFYDLVGNPIIFDQSSGVMRVRLEMEEATYFEGASISPIRLTQQDLNGFAGKYRSEELDVTYTVGNKEGAVTVVIGDKPPLQLQAVAINEFYSPDTGTLVFSLSPDHQVSGLTVYTQSARGIHFSKVR